MAEDQNRSYQDKFMLRMPEGMRDQIKALADGLGISMNAHIVHMLEVGLDAVPELYREIDENALEIERLNAELAGLRELLEAKQATIDVLKTSEAETRKNMSGISDSVNNLFSGMKEQIARMDRLYEDERRHSEVYKNAFRLLYNSITAKGDNNSEDVSLLINALLPIAEVYDVDILNMPEIKARIDAARREAEAGEADDGRRQQGRKELK
jgi:hypothetical protein